MRVLITTDSYYPQVNGASYFAQRLATNLTHRGHEVLVTAPSMSFQPGHLTVAGIGVYGVRSVPVFFYKGMRVAMPVDLERTTISVLRRFGPHVVHAQGHFPISQAVIRGARVLGIPIVGTNHFMPENLTHYAHLPAPLDVRLRRRLWSQFRRVYEGLDEVTTPTRTAADYMKRSGFSKEIKVISNGIDLERFHPGEGDPELRRTYRLPDAPLLLYVGRLDKEKNLDLVLEAVRRLPADFPLHFAIAGTGAQRERLVRLVGRLSLTDRVTFLGFVPDSDLPALYRTADCFVMAGTAELQSIATMEAMASGLPVLAVDAMALPELAHDAENGYLFDQEDPEGLCQKMQTVFANVGLRRRMAESSLELIQKHALARTLEEFESVYESVILRRSGIGSDQLLPAIDDTIDDCVDAPAGTTAQPLSRGLEVSRSTR